MVILDLKLNKKKQKKGSHCARFGEVEQRGAALTAEGRRRYDEVIARATQMGLLACPEGEDESESEAASRRAGRVERASVSVPVLLPAETF